MSRQALLQSAITFLRDPTTSSSPLAQRIAFLESKGLTPQEIEQALSQAASPQQIGPVIPGQQGPAWGRRGPGGMGPGGGQMEFERDWRDWFIMGVVGGTVGWVCIKLAQKYLMPHLQPPTSSDLAASQAALEAKYDEAADLLKQLQSSTDLLTTTIDEQKEVVDNQLEEVRKAVEEMRLGEKRRDEWAKDVEAKVEEVTRGLPVMLEKQSQTTSQSLTELQTELKSLKSLLIARRPTTPSTSSSPSVPTTSAAGGYGSTSTSSTGFVPRAPGIPAWQLAASSTPAATTTPAPAASSSSSSAVAGGSGSASGSGEKEKEKEKEEDTSASGILVEKDPDTPKAVSEGYTVS